MTEKEERIRVLMAKNPCKECSVKKCTRKCMFCLLFEKAPGITRQEAIERMAKALCSCQTDGCKNCYVKDNKEACLFVLVDGLYTRHAEAALDALLGESND